MDNGHYADLLEEASALLQILDENQFRIRAYDRAARAVRGLSSPVEELLDNGELTKVPGIGKGIAAELQEFAIRRSSVGLDQLRASLPENIGQLLQVHGMGPKRVRLVWTSLGIADLKSLEQAAKSGQLETLPGMGAKTVQNILKEIDRLKRSAGRIPFHIARRAADEVIKILSKLPEVERIEYAGSLRRGRTDVKDLDLVVASNDPKTVMDAFVSMSNVIDIHGRGDTKSTVILDPNLPCDLRVVPPDVFGATLHHFTGSKDHNVMMRSRAVKMGLRISEYGVFKRDGEDETPVACLTEEDVFAAVGLPWIPPEIREGGSEIERALDGSIPELIDLKHMRGDVHMHSSWSDGRHTIAEMAEAAKARGLSYICMTDHSRSLTVANGLDRDRMLRQIDEIAAFNESSKDFRVLCGLEVDIMEHGDLDMDEDILTRLDFVVGSVHQWMKQPKKVMTERVVRAVRSGLIHAVGHPTGRLIGYRDGYEIDLDELFIACAESKVALEVNSSDRRLDLDSSHIQRALQDQRIRFVINTDAHSTSGLASMTYGVMTARRGWMPRDRVLNQLPLEELLQWSSNRSN